MSSKSGVFGLHKQIALICFFFQELRKESNLKLGTLMKECFIKYVFDQEGGIYMVEDKLLKDIIEEWKEDKKQYVKKSTFAAYQLLIQNHILPRFGEMKEVKEEDVQSFALEKLNAGLSEKTIKDIIIVLKMIQNSLLRVDT